MDTTDDVMFARNGLDNPLGKLGKSFKTDVDFDTGAAFEKRCHEAGTNPAAMLRDHIYELMHGKTFIDICHDAAKVKRSMFFGKRPNGSVLGDPDIKGGQGA